MPKTKFQEVIFGIIMVCVMVYGMICYNLALPAGKLEPYMFLEAAKTLPLVGLIAFLVEFFFVEKLATKCALRMTNPETEHPFHFILAMAAATISMMCPIMSFITMLIYHNPGMSPELLSVWLTTAAKNFPMALCLQIFFAGPLVRLIFRTIFERNPERAAQMQEHLSKEPAYEKNTVVE